MDGTAAALQAVVARHGTAGGCGRWAPLQMLDGSGGPARLVFWSGGGRRHTARLHRWLAVIRPAHPAGRSAWVVWLLDARTVRWSGGLPPGDLHRGATGLDCEETPILWFRASGADGGRRTVTASGVFGAAGIMDAARVRIAARPMRRPVQLRMMVNPQLWGLAAAPEAVAGADPELTITAAGTPRPLDLEAIRTWM